MVRVKLSFDPHPRYLVSEGDGSAVGYGNTQIAKREGAQFGHSKAS